MAGYTTIYENIVFIEGPETDCEVLGQVKSDLSFKIGAQLKNLNDVKSDLALQAKKKGANAVINFIYGQKSRLLAIDDVAYFGEGIAVILSAGKLNELKEKINNR